VKVLLVDDLPDARFMLRRRLEREKVFQIVGEASNGQEALRLAEQHQPDVVIMDFRMPVMDGVEATKILKEKFPAIQVIGFTAYEDPEMRERMLEAGASHNVNKTDMHSLIDLLRTRLSA
jgi:DNA-binding NarL/FixJ family response regulator